MMHLRFCVVLRTAAFFLALGLGSLLAPAPSEAWNPLVYNGRCRESGTRCDSTVGNAGGQGACCDPANPRGGGYSNIADCANRNACTGGAPYKWTTIPLTWYWNPNNRPGGFQRRTEDQYETALREAVDAWSKPNCTSFRNTYGGRTTTRGASTRDGVVVLYFPTTAEWAQFGAGSSTLAFARPIPANTQGHLSDGDVIFNPNLSWGTPTVANNEYDITSVAAHEFGHAIGLGHSQFSSALMFYATSGNGDLWVRTYNRSLPSDDVTAVCSTYPRVNCTQASDCSGCFTCGSNGTCVPRSISTVNNLCKPCSKPDDCGGTGDICIRTEEGNRCAQACDNDGCCPDGYRCADVGGGLRQCIPVSGSCPPVSCSTNTQCGPGESCQSGTCKPIPVPADPNTCKRCTNNTCSNNNRCFQISGEDRCLQPCAFDNFCPNGYYCQTTGSGRFCVPDDGICPCTADADCQTGFICRNTRCQRPGGGTTFEPCGEQQPCATGYDCTPTQGGSVCIQFCGSNASSAPAGSPGSACTGAGACSNGAQCFQLQGGSTLCMPQTCGNSGGSCTNGGQCYDTRQIGFRCFCTADSECRNGFTCNKAVISQLFGQSIGACAPASAPVSCFAGTACKDANNPANNCAANSQACICYPTGTRNAGESCSQNDLCKDGLDCLGLGNQNICFQRCQQGQPGQCSTGGACNIPANNDTYFCGCSASAPCPAGKRCNIVLQGGLGYCVDSTPQSCGNNACEGANGENCATCPQDCPCSGGTQCINNICQTPQASCGNGNCESSENCTNCPADCPCPSGQNCDAGVCKSPNPCGNGSCDNGENCASCPADCACPAGQACQDNACKTLESCGNNACDNGENCTSCPQDCPCSSGQICEAGICKTPPPDGGNTEVSPDNNNGLPCPPSEQFESCDVEGKNCMMMCALPRTGGCACDANSPAAPVQMLLFLLFFLMLFSRKRRASSR